MGHLCLPYNSATGWVRSWQTERNIFFKKRQLYELHGIRYSFLFSVIHMLNLVPVRKSLVAYILKLLNTKKKISNYCTIHNSLS